MKRRGIAVICVLSLALLFTGCANLTGGKAETEKKKETETTESAEPETKRETETETETSTELPAAPEVGLGGKETTGTGTSSVKETQPATEAAKETQAAQTQTEGNQAAQTQTEAESQWSGAPQSPQVYEEEMMQCPYCAHWFSTVPDDDLWNPYDRHMLEERESDAAGGQTEADMVQCPDCKNWYEAGNVFRNHLCTGQQ